MPRPYGIIDNGVESLSYVQGEVYNNPLPKFMLQDHMIIFSAKLLRSFHEVIGRYIDKITHKEEWMLPSVDPIEVM